MDFDWDGFLKELDRELKEEKVWALGLFARLLNDRWKILSLLTRGKGIDSSLKRVTMRPPEDAVLQKLLEEEVFVVCVDRSQFLRFHRAFPGTIPEGPVFVHHVFLDPGMILLVLSQEDVSSRLGEAVKKLFPPRQARYALYRDVNLELVFDCFLLSLTSLLESVEPYTYHHSLRVALLGASIARHLGLPKEKEKEVRVASLIHDLGKILIPREILHKPGRLTPEEFEEVKKHVFELPRIFLGNEFLERHVSLARLHHERLDGSGYLGLKGKDIPLEARILAVCDVFDALVHVRPHRRAYTLEEAFQELHTLTRAGKFDSKVFWALLEVLPEYCPVSAKGQLLFLPPGTEVRVQRISSEEEEAVEEFYLGKVEEMEKDKLAVVFGEEVPLVSGERVSIFWNLSYFTVELWAKCITSTEKHATFLLQRAEHRETDFTLWWNLDIRFMKIDSPPGKDIVAEVTRNLPHLREGQTESIGMQWMTFSTRELGLKVGDRIAVLFEAYGERFVIPAQVEKVEDLGFAYRVIVVNFALKEQEAHRLHTILSQRQRELLTGVREYSF